MKRRLLALVGFVLGVLVTTFAYRRSAGRRRDRLDIYFDDGSMVSFVEGSSEAERLLPVARELLATARR
jgi:hypothetical protein